MDRHMTVPKVLELISKLSIFVEKLEELLNRKEQYGYMSLSEDETKLLFENMLKIVNDEGYTTGYEEGYRKCLSEHNETFKDAKIHLN